MGETGTSIAPGSGRNYAGIRKNHKGVERFSCHPNKVVALQQLQHHKSPLTCNGILDLIEIDRDTNLVVIYYSSSSSASTNKKTVNSLLLAS